MSFRNREVVLDTGFIIRMYEVGGLDAFRPLLINGNRIIVTRTVLDELSGSQAYSSLLDFFENSTNSLIIEDNLLLINAYFGTNLTVGSGQLGDKSIERLIASQVDGYDYDRFNLTIASHEGGMIRDYSGLNPNFSHSRRVIQGPFDYIEALYLDGHISYAQYDQFYGQLESNQGKSRRAVKKIYFREKLSFDEGLSLRGSSITLDEKLRVSKTLTVLKAAGIAGDVLTLAITFDKVHDLIAVGDSASLLEAEALLASTLSGMAGGALGGVAAGMAAGLVVSATGIGALPGGAIIAISSLIGAYAGGEIGEAAANYVIGQLQDKLANGEPLILDDIVEIFDQYARDNNLGISTYVDVIDGNIKITQLHDGSHYLSLRERRALGMFGENDRNSWPARYYSNSAFPDGFVRDSVIEEADPYGLWGRFGLGWDISDSNDISFAAELTLLLQNVPLEHLNTVTTTLANGHLQVGYDTGTAVVTLSSQNELSDYNINLLGDYKVSHSFDGINLRRTFELNNAVFTIVYNIEGVGNNRVETPIRAESVVNGLTKVTEVSSDGNGNVIIGDTKLGIDPDATPDQINTAQMNAIYGQIGNVIGSTIGGVLAGELGLDGAAGVVADTVSSAVFGQIGAAFGAALQEGDFLDNFGDNLHTAFSSAQLGQALGSTAVGTISSLLTAEMADALGLDGVAGEVFGVVGSSLLNGVVSQSLETALNTVFENVGTTVFGQAEGGGGGVSGALGSYLGAKLGALVVSPTTQAGAVLSSLGSSVGALISSQIFGKSASLLLNVLIPGVGAFIGFVLGALIGNLFGKKKPRIPLADAETVLNFNSGYFELGAVSSADGGNEDLVIDMANAAADTLNAFIDVVGGKDLGAENINMSSPTQTYGHEGNQIYVKLGYIRYDVDTADVAVDKGTLFAIKQTQISGGNLMLKRAVLASTATSLLSFSGDLKVAEDYATYKLNQETIDAAIAAPYDSLSDVDKVFFDTNAAKFSAVQQSDHAALVGADLTWYNANKARVDSIIETVNSMSQFAAGWIVTLQRAAELGLNRSAKSDFYGGAKGFIDSLSGLVSVPISYANIAFNINDGDLEVVRDANKDGIAGADEDVLFNERNLFNWTGHADGGAGFHLAATDADMRTGNDYINLTGTADLNVDDLTSQTVLEARQGVEYPDGPYRPVYYTYNVSVIRTVEGGDDIIIGNAGANVLNGRSGHDWLDGEAGNDTLYGGADHDVLLGRSGNDTLYGDDGDDALFAGSGTDIMYGGVGDDVLHGGTGTGSSTGHGGDGDDLYYTRANSSNGVSQDTFNGGNGQDIVSFANLDADLIITLASGDASYTVNGDTVTLNSVEGVEGSAFDDIITGNANNNILRGGVGDDILTSGGGADVLEGGAGADEFITNNGSITTVSYEHSLGGVDVSIQVLESLGGQHAFGGDASGDSFTGYMANLTGSNYSDVLEGNNGNNILTGLEGDDYFIASNGLDVIFGGEGFDTVDYSNHTGTTGLELGIGVTYQLWGTTFTTPAGAGYNNGVDTPVGNDTLHDIEHIVGTDNADTIRFGEGDNVLEGGKGNDMLYGGTGNDVYFVGLGGGLDTIYEYDNGGYDTIMTDAGDYSWDDVNISTGTYLDITVNGEHLAHAINGPSATRESVGIDALDIGGTGAVDIWYITGGAAYGGGSAGNDVLSGSYYSPNSLLQGFDGNDTIYAAGYATAWEDADNFLHGGRGNDTIYASVGDDQYIFDRGSGMDTITDSGGIDHIQFGPGVAAQDIVYEIYGNDLYIGIAPEGTNDTSSLNARQMVDHIRIVNGGFGAGNLIEYITVANINIDMRTLGLDWIGGGSSTGGGTTNPDPDPDPYPDPDPFPNPNDPYDNIDTFLYPIAFDLDGDGLELVSINESRIVVKGADRSLTRMGWIGADDGLLALDRNGNGKIDNISEISFVDDLEGATTDFEGLRAYDSNEDGVLDANDDRFSEFLIFQDRNQNGRGGRRELMSLEEAGITSINLDLQTTGNETNNFADNVVLNTASYLTSDGETHTAYDVAFGSSILREGRDSARTIVGYAGDDKDGRLGRISRRRLERLLARQSGNASNGIVTPIVLDLDGDGIELTHYETSGVTIDVNEDGAVDRLGWVGADDGILALDRNGDGVIKAVSEISFVDDLEGARTDLEGLAAFDSNGDGYIDGDDARYAEFYIWQDLNQDGASSANELVTLEEAGLLRINLEAHTGQESIEGALSNVVFGLTATHWADGSEGVAGDVGLAVAFSDIGVTGPVLFGYVGVRREDVEALVFQSAWGQIGRNRTARVTRYSAFTGTIDDGLDTGFTQDELLADFDAGSDDEDVAANSNIANVDGAIVTNTATLASTVVNSEAGGDETSDQAVREDLTLPFLSPRDQFVAALQQNEFEQKQELTSVGPSGSLAQIDAFTQAMAGFGTDNGMSGLNSMSPERDKQPAFGVNTRWKPAPNSVSQMLA